MLDITYRISADLSRTGHQKGITADAVGRWRRIFTPGELTVCQMVAGEELASLGYERVAISLSGRFAASFLLLRSPIEFVQRLYRKSRLAGPGYVWNVIVNYGRRLRQLLRPS